MDCDDRPSHVEWLKPVTAVIPIPSQSGMCCERDDVEREARIAVVTQWAAREIVESFSRGMFTSRIEDARGSRLWMELIRKRIAKSGLSQVDILCCSHAEPR